MTRDQVQLHGPAGIPLDVDGDVTARANAGDAALAPRLRQRRQDVDLAVLALQQHLDDAGRGAEVAVDLERRMRVPQVGQRAVAQQAFEQLVRAVAVAQARPEVDLPRAAPARAGVAARIERGARRGGELGVLHRIDRVPGMQREQVRHVPVIVLRIVEIGLPFLQLAPLADAQAAIEFRERIVDALREHLVADQLRGGRRCS